MDNNLLSPRTNSNFSIASLITTDCCNDENNLYHPMINPIELNFTSNNYSVEKIPSDYYSNSTQQDLHPFHSDTLTETNNEQYQQQQQPIKRRKINFQKSSTTKKEDMEGLLNQIKIKQKNILYIS